MAVACGYNFSAAVGEDGSLVAFGANEFGQLGTGDAAPRLAPTRVAELPALVRQVATGSNHTGIVTDAGDLFMCGYGIDGKLGLDDNNQATPTLVPRANFGGEAVLMVACGDSHTAVVTEGGGVFTFGVGQYGRLGHGTQRDKSAPTRVPVENFKSEQIVMVAAGREHTVAVSEAGHVFTWGLGWQGQLGHNDIQNQLTPQQVNHGCFVPKGAGQGEKVVFVAAGADHTVAVTAGGRLYTWGYGVHGQLGHGRGVTSLKVPTVVGALGGGKVVMAACGSSHTLVVVPTVVGALESEKVVMAACGSYHTLVVTQDGALWACGLNCYGQLGLGDITNRQIFTRVVSTLGDMKVVVASAGARHSAAVTEDGALWTWGQGLDEITGHGDKNDSKIPNRVWGLGTVRIGRCLELPQDDAMAFAMATHHRLGDGKHEKDTKQSLRVTKQASPANMLTDDLVRKIVDIARSWPKGLTKREEGLGRLLGGGLTPLELWPKPGAGQETQTAMSTMSHALVKVCKPCRVSVSAQNL